MESEPEGLCLDPMTLHAMCISGSNLEGKMEAAMQCFTGSAATRDSSDIERRSRRGRCPSFAALKSKMSQEMSESDCLYRSMGWMDENGNEVNATISADIGSLDNAIGSQLGPDAIGECVVNMLGVMAEDPKYARCANKYTETQTQVLEEIAIKMASYECFSNIFDMACKNFIQTTYVDPMLASFMGTQTATGRK